MLLAFTNVWAQCPPEVIDRYHQKLRGLEVQLFEAKQVLLDNEPADWTTSQQQTYLNSALWVVYYGMLTYGLDGHFALPGDFSELTSLGYIQTWPGNPYNDWEPMQVLSPGDGFAPGEICLLLAPPSHRDGKSKMASEMCIYGPDIQFSAFGDAEVLEGNEDWAEVPEGAVFMFGIG